MTALSLHTGEDAITLLGVYRRARAQAQDFDFKGEPAGRGWTDLGPIDLFGGGILRDRRKSLDQILELPATRA